MCAGDESNVHSFICSQHGTYRTSRPKAANADGPRNTASRKIDHIALPNEDNYQTTCVG